MVSKWVWVPKEERLLYGLELVPFKLYDPPCPFDSLHIWPLDMGIDMTYLGIGGILIIYLFITLTTFTADI